MHPMIESMVTWTSIAAAAVAVGTALLNRAIGRPVLLTAAVAEVAVVVQSVAAVVALSRGHELPSTATFVGYLVAILVILPLAVGWAWADRSQWSGAVVALGALTVAVMTVRLHQMWYAHA